MTDYFVRTTGSDAAAGTSAGTAWLTIDKAANTVAAGDTVYIGAGTYRELVTMDTSGTSGNLISYIADIDGSQTGDAGLVIISAHNSNTGAAIRDHCLDFQDKQFIAWYGVVFYGGLKSPVRGNTVTDLAYEGVTFELCTFVLTIRPQDIYNCVFFQFNDGATPATTGLTFKKCSFINSGAGIQFNHHPSEAKNFKTVFENCRFTGVNNTSFGINFQRVSNDTFKSGGCTINNCTFMLCTGVRATDPDSTAYPVSIRNSMFHNCTIGIEQWFGTAGSVTSNYNAFQGCNSNVSGLSAGANDIANGEFMLLGGFVDHMLYETFGWSPYKPWEPIDGNGLIDAGTATSMPTEDLYGNPRPMGRNALDVGAIEARIRPAQESTTVNNGTYSARFDGAGYYDALRAVDASATTITVYCQKDANYTGTAPKLEVVNIPGVADQSDSLSVGSGSWEQLSVTFTPTSAGWVRIRLWSYDTSATGKCFFDDLAVS